jgi:hypothetical protein
MENTIFFGNGLNLVIDKTLSWQSLLGANGILPPYTMVYEKKVLNKKTIDDAKLKKEIIKKLKAVKPNPIYELMYNSNIQNFITTNYDYGFIKSLSNTLKVKNIRPESRYSIRRNQKINESKCIWHIHGEIDRSHTIMLGLHHYCGYISKIDDYIRGVYRGKGFDPKDTIKMKDKIKNGTYSSVSWVDLFFSTNVHFIGYGLDYSETDIWWILNSRARWKKDKTLEHKIKNSIYFYCAQNEIDNNKKELLQSFGVEVHEIETSEERLNKKNYEQIIRDIDNKNII